ncbi:Uncharacterised protein [Mycobacteroides abscessus]|nr:Uncharacterised protein [Mycobacteroides abscessus]
MGRWTTISVMPASAYPCAVSTNASTDSSAGSGVKPVSRMRSTDPGSRPASRHAASSRCTWSRTAARDCAGVASSPRRPSPVVTHACP